MTFLTQKSIVELNNVADFLSILPDELEVDMEIVLNKGFNDYLYADFLHSGASFAANFNLDIPLVTSASGLELFEVSSVKLDELELPVGVNNGVLSLIVNNGFPIDADLDLFFTTSTGKMLKAFSSDQIIRAATINPIDNKVSAKTKTKIDYTIDYDDVQLLKEATNMMVKAKFDTPSTVPFYSYYSFDVQVVADFGYQVNKAK